MQIKTLDLNKLKKAPYNPRHISEEARKGLEESIKRFGLVELIIYNERTGNVVHGHQRLDVLLSQGVTKEKCIIVDLNESEEKALNITMNNPNIQGEFTDRLQSLITEIDTGLDDILSDLRIDELLEEVVTEPEPIEVSEHYRMPPEPKNDRNIKVGDVYTLGKHRLMCGDSTIKADVKKLMNGKKSSISFTSPPYNVGAMEINGQPGTDKKYISGNDSLDDDSYLKLLITSTELMLKHSDEVFINLGLVEGNKRSIIKLLDYFIFSFKDIIYWKKNTCAPHIQPGIINNLVEFILCFGKGGKRKFKNAQFSQGTYWNVIEGSNSSSNEYSEIHKATFPVYLPIEIINNFSNEKDIIYEPFAGTGTTGIACEELKRACHMMELEPAYCNVIIDRWESFTNKKAKKVN